MVVVKGSEKIPSEPGILTPNHSSSLDILIMMSTSINTRFIMKRELMYYMPLIFVAAWMFGHVPIDRKNRVKSIQAINQSGKLNQKILRKITIFPEGTRNSNSELLPFKKGAFYLASQNKIKIIPVLISGANDLWPTKNWIPKPGIVQIKYLKPINYLTSDSQIKSPEEFSNETRDTLIKAIKADNFKSYPSLDPFDNSFDNALLFLVWFTIFIIATISIYIYN